MRKIILVAALALLILVALLPKGCALISALTPPTLPPYEAPAATVWLNQNWENQSRYWFHHTPQGTQTVTMPKSWFLALEQPKLFPKGALLRDTEYLARFGFIPSPTGRDYDSAQNVAGYGFSDNQEEQPWSVDFDRSFFQGNPEGLPVGFALTKDQKDPFTGKALDPMLGFTCATCHTGELTYQGTSIRIDGGPAQINLAAFNRAIGVALAYTKLVPGRFDRFAERVLGANATKDEIAALKKEFNAFLEKGREMNAPLAITEVEGVPEGFTRLDALNRIGTRLFYQDLFGHSDLGIDPKKNIVPNNAPVNYPHIWSTPWFDWVQYDASIMQPMIRNAGEALGVEARLNIARTERVYDSTVLVRELYQLEDLLSGPQPTEEQRRFLGLRAPRWPQGLFGPINQSLARRGEFLYREHCVSCHLPSVHSDEFWSDRYWQPIQNYNGRYLQVRTTPVDIIGTDPQQAKVLRDRKILIPDAIEVPEPKVELGGLICDPIPGSGPQKETLFAWALAFVTEQAVNNRYDALGIGPEEREIMNGERPNCVRATYSYKARPLNGIWATAPFLHNGSVLNLYELLGPAADRRTSICLGDREFDPERVGLVGRCIEGTTQVDTSLLGNLASGHSFEDSFTGEPKNGVIGPALSEDERLALIEYLKTQ